MNLQLANKLALVTGSSDGIGKAIAQELARQGSRVIVNGRSDDKIQAAVNEIVQETGNPQVFGCSGDLSSNQGVSEFLAKVTQFEQQVQRPLDILVNNIWFFHVQEFEEIPDEKWLEYYEVNTMSGVRLARHFLPRMLEQNNHGRILFVSSEAGLRGLPHMSAYSVSKASQITLARSLAERTKGTTVTVNSIVPGPTMTTGVKQYMMDFGKSHGIESLDEAVARYFAEHERTSLLQRFLDPKEIADPAAFLCSPLASGINGFAQLVDGGIVQHI